MGEKSFQVYISTVFLISLSFFHCIKQNDLEVYLLLGFKCYLYVVRYLFPTPTPSIFSSHLFRCLLGISTWMHNRKLKPITYLKLNLWSTYFYTKTLLPLWQVAVSSKWAMGKPRSENSPLTSFLSLTSYFQAEFIPHKSKVPLKLRTIDLGFVESLRT